MKSPVLLRQLEYKIPVSDKKLVPIPHQHCVAEHLPLLYLKVDFEESWISVEGDWQYMVLSNRYFKPHWLDYKSGRVKIDMKICQGESVRLNDPYSDGLVFVMKGEIADGNYTSPCSGILVIENIRSEGHITDCWQLTLCICDVQFQECEIRFSIPVFISHHKESCN